MVLIILAGFRATMTSLEKLLVTTESSPTTTLLPKVAPGHKTLLPTIQALSPMEIGLANSNPLFPSL